MQVEQFLLELWVKLIIYQKLYRDARSAKFKIGFSVWFIECLIVMGVWPGCM
jgi:hypothetical protein